MIWSWKWSIPGAILSDVLFCLGLLILAWTTVEVVAQKISSRSSWLNSAAWSLIIVTVMLRFLLIRSTMSLEHLKDEGYVALTRVLLNTFTVPFAFALISMFSVCIRASRRLSLLVLVFSLAALIVLGVLAVVLYAYLWPFSQYHNGPPFPFP